MGALERHGGPGVDEQGLLAKKEDPMRISVALATWNGERFLEEQLKSIAAQSRLPDQLVLSDDASSDATLDVASRFAEHAPLDVVIMPNSHRVGYNGNFMRAIAACTGDLIALSDQDDVWHPKKLELSARAFEADPAVSLVTHSARAVDEYLQPTWSDRSNQIRKHRRVPPGSLPPFPRARAGCMMTFRSTYLHSVDFADRPRAAPHGNEPLTHDAWIQIICGALGAIVLLPEELVLYRRHASTATETSSGHRTMPGYQTRPLLVRVQRWIDRQVRPSLVLHAEQEAYMTRTALVRERIAYLETVHPLARTLGGVAEQALARTIETHERYGRAMAVRAHSYSSDMDRRARLRAVLRHAATGGYTSRARGGLGLPSLVRDLTVGARRPSPPLETD